MQAALFFKYGNTIFIRLRVVKSKGSIGIRYGKPVVECTGIGCKSVAAVFKVLDVSVSGIRQEKNINVEGSISPFTWSSAMV